MNAQGLRDLLAVLPWVRGMCSLGWFQRRLIHAGRRCPAWGFHTRAQQWGSFGPHEHPRRRNAGHRAPRVRWGSARTATFIKQPQRPGCVSFRAQDPVLMQILGTGAWSRRGGNPAQLAAPAPEQLVLLCIPEAEIL